MMRLVVPTGILLAWTSTVAPLCAQDIAGTGRGSIADMPRLLGIPGEGTFDWVSPSLRERVGTVDVIPPRWDPDPDPGRPDGPGPVMVCSGGSCEPPEWSRVQRCSSDRCIDDPKHPWVEPYDPGRNELSGPGTPRVVPPAHPFGRTD